MTSLPPGASDDALIGLNRLATAARLFAGAAHDVNNALQVISGTVEILEMQADLPVAVVESLARLRHQSVRAAAALGLVSAFTRAPRDGSGLVNLREVADDSLALRDFAIRRARLSARLEAESGTSYLVVGNRADLQQAVLNVIINAEQALANASGTIVVRLQMDAGSVVLRVIDSGERFGIEPHERAFEPFVTGGEPFETAGLGLWASRRLVERHGGQLDIEPRTGGTSVVIRLPAVQRALP